MAQRVLVLPGSSSPRHPKYVPVYEDLLGAARDRGLSSQLVLFPGQDPGRNDLLTHRQSVSAALAAAREFQPDWLVARCYGCVVALELLRLREAWVAQCRGAVLYGPVLRAAYDCVMPDRESTQTFLGSVAGTRMDPDFYPSDELPFSDELVDSISLPLWFARGSLERDNSMEDLQAIAAAYGPTGQGCRWREVAGAPHSVSRASLPEAVWQEYEATLLDPLTGPVTEQDRWALRVPHSPR